MRKWSGFSYPEALPLRGAWSLDLSKLGPIVEVRAVLRLSLVAFGFPGSLVCLAAACSWRLGLGMALLVVAVLLRWLASLSYG